MTRKDHLHDIPRPVTDVARDYVQGKLSRRQFLKIMGALGVSLAATHSIVGRVSAQDGTMSSAKAAEEAAKKFAGETVNVVWEGGLQAQDPLLFSGPLWKERTGVDIKVVEIPGGNELYSRQLQEGIAKSGAFDLLAVSPSWVPDYVLANMLIPLDDLIKQYMVAADLDDIVDLYRGMGTYDGKTYGLFDDGDTLLLYYRKDLFEQNGDEFAQKMGYKLAPPTNYKEMADQGRFFNDKLKGTNTFALGFGRATGAGGNSFLFLQHFKANGGKLFDVDSLKATINSGAGVRTVREMAFLNQFAPPGIEQVTPVDAFQQWLAGNYVMTWFWPPLGRWSAGYGQQAEQMAFLPKSQVIGKTGYSLYPGDTTQMAGGFVLSVSADSPRQELAYLLAQWLNSPEISLQRVTLPFALRDPFRKSHFASAEYKKLWDDADQYLATLQAAAENASLDILMPGGQQFLDAIDRACTSVYAGTDAQAAMDTAAGEFDAINERLGMDRQKAAYANYITLKGAYPTPKLVDAPSPLDA
jgi:multiple sugar transport system substrate-binding protein